MAEQQNVGTIVEIKGVVIDAVFPDRLPGILTALEIQVPREDGSTTLVAEVQQHLESAGGGGPEEPGRRPGAGRRDGRDGRSVARHRRGRHG
jgi:hypothetical protein